MVKKDACEIAVLIVGVSGRVKSPMVVFNKPTVELCGLSVAG